MNRTGEAVTPGVEQIAVACRLCRVMLSDGLTSLRAGGTAREEVEILDVAQLLLAAVQRPGTDPHPAPDTATDTEAIGRAPRRVK
jgi:hypothetical protein